MSTVLPALTPTTTTKLTRAPLAGPGPEAPVSTVAALTLRPVVLHVGPHWFAWVMGTGIVAVALANLPLTVLGMTAPLELAPVRVVATAFWLAATLVLVAVGSATARQWATRPDLARGHLADPVRAHFYGAPAMALMTVGAGCLALGEPLVGAEVTVVVASGLWAAGTVAGLVTAVLLPYRAFVGDGAAPDAAFGGWLMPVVPPMVSAATGAALVPHLPAGQARLTMLLLGYALFGLTLVASLFVIGQLWTRLVHHPLPVAGAVPTLWIVLGPLGQSITAAGALGAQAGASGVAHAGAFAAFGVLYGVPVLGFALLWAALAGAITLRTVRAGMPFTLTWWSFTFPVGTVVTGVSGLAVHTGSVALAGLALIAFVALLTAWATVAIRTLRALR